MGEAGGRVPGEHRVRLPGLDGAHPRLEVVGHTRRRQDAGQDGLQFAGSHQPVERGDQFRVVLAAEQAAAFGERLSGVGR